MKTLTNKLLLIAILCMPACGISAYDYDIAVENDDGVTIYYHYINDKMELEVTRKDSYSNYIGDVKIPEEIVYGQKTYKVTGIRYAFVDCTGLTSVTIPNSVTYIGVYAFSGCTGLASVTIPNSVTSIGSSAFCGCTGLTSITIPNSVTYIGVSAFQDCTGLTSVKIGTGVMLIEGSAFEGCTGLTKVIVPDIAAWCNISFSYDGIGNPISYAQHIYSDENTEITNLVIPNGVTSISNYAFSGCIGLASVTIPNSVASIGTNAFEGCTGLTKVIVPDITAWNSIEFSNNSANPLLYGHRLYGDENTEITNLVIPNDVTSIGNYAFSGGTGLTSVTIPNSVMRIGEKAFYNTCLRSVTIGTGVMSIGSKAFGYDSSSSGAMPVKVIWLPNTPPEGYKDADGVLNYVPNNLYTSLSSMTRYSYLSSIFEVDGVKYVPVSPSKRTCDAIDCVYDSSAENVNIGKTVTYKGISMTVSQIKLYVCYQNPEIKNVNVSLDNNIPQYAFYGCTSLEDVSISNKGYIAREAFKESEITGTLTVNNIGNIEANAFENVTGSYSANINNTGTIGNYAFKGSTGLRQVEIGDDVTRIGDYAFQNCSNMLTATLGGNITSIWVYAFDGCTSLQGINIPDAVTSVGDHAFQNCTGMTTAKVGTGVTLISKYTFSGCSDLADMQMGSNVKRIGTYAFSGCSSLPSIFIPKAVTSVGDYTFSGCSKLKEVVIEDRDDDTLSLGSNGSNPLFADCPLDSVYIGRNISYSTESSAGYSPFYGNTTLSTVNFKNDMTNISAYEFSGCTGLKSFTFPNSVETIEKGAFSYCTGFTDFVIPNSVTSIGDKAFFSCSSLKSLNMGSDVKTIGQEALTGCSSLTNLICSATVPPTCGTNALTNINKFDCTLTIPEGTLAAYQAADQWKDFFFIEEKDLTGIAAIEPDGIKDSEVIGIYDLNGRRIDKMQRGLNIIKMSDGKTKKVVIK